MNFPKKIEFAEVVPLGKTFTKNVILENSTEVDYAFDIKILSSHDYITIEPKHGIVSSNGNLTIVIKYTPLTCGLSTMKVKFASKAKDNYSLVKHAPSSIECMIYGRSIPGLIEKEELSKARDRIANLITQKSEEVNGALQSTFGKTGYQSISSSSTSSDTNLMKTLDVAWGTATIEPINPETQKDIFTSFVYSNRPESIRKAKKQKELCTNMRNDPVLTMLNSTFHAKDTQSALANSLIPHHCRNHSKIRPVVDSAPLLPGRTVVLPGTHEKVSAAEASAVRPRGPGSGAVFDAGSEWMALQFRAKHKARIEKYGEVVRPPRVWK